MPVEGHPATVTVAHNVGIHHILWDRSMSFTDTHFRPQTANI